MWSMETILREAYEAFCEDKRAHGEEVLLGFDEEISLLIRETECDTFLDFNTHEGQYADELYW